MICENCFCVDCKSFEKEVLDVFWCGFHKAFFPINQEASSCFKLSKKLDEIKALSYEKQLEWIEKQMEVQDAITIIFLSDWKKEILKSINKDS